MGCSSSKTVIPDVEKENFWRSHIRIRLLAYLDNSIFVEFHPYLYLSNFEEIPIFNDWVNQISENLYHLTTQKNTPRSINIPVFRAGGIELHLSKFLTPLVKELRKEYRKM